ncbi:YgfZ/GcvT domain-containing protein [Piscinibacter sp.]|uniref:CAF17-like 4Fe-4S cluster assembly/insertion protein YgfZ n=1 Tax=Piscinibacter sp. TaxID=1903157 RepID=UPI002C74F27E|nr:folate-binding protein [Albitalea sp.]HUG23326.1 folate-binding protein [Albitalea sp.]
MNMTTSVSGAVPLSHWGVIRARGADAATFLQGQLTNDVVQLGASQARLAGYCSAKGRMLASFLVWKAAPDDILLACHASVLPATLKRLSMFVLRAQCKLSDASAEVPLVGLAGAAAVNAAGDMPAWQLRELDGGWLLRLPDAAGTPRALLAANQGPGTWPAITLDAWRWLDIQSGVPVIEAPTVEQFVPQMLNFELIGGVNFQKGCYPGQEVVARSHYRGTVKRRMFLFDADAAAAPGQEVFHSSDPGQPAGLVANAAPRPDGAGSSALVELKLAALAGGSIHLGTPDGALLHRRELPYPVPTEADQPA